jgi:hypothetical protein
VQIDLWYADPSRTMWSWWWRPCMDHRGLISEYLNMRRSTCGMQTPSRAT